VDSDRREVDLRGAQGAQIGDGNIQLNVFVEATRAGLRPDAYLEQVRRIAPPELVGRGEELAALARFCVAPDAGPYAWWQAGPWAGKSALLATFVLRPPAEVAGQVRIVAFFITARLAAQDTRRAFTEVLLQQLAALLGQSLPTVLPAATREAYLLDLLSQAAAACQTDGRRLVLVVDGLDEDRGAATGRHRHSIAGLLPANPPAGMRVIVASRPDPPVRDVAGVAVKLAKAGDTHAAARVAAALCTVATWPASVLPVFLLEPAAFPALARTLAALGDPIGPVGNLISDGPG
jgi:hypothetical protein